MKRIAAIIALSAVLAFPACKSAKKADDESITSSSTGPVMDDSSLGDSDNGKAMGLQTVHFPYDSFNLDGSAKDTLKANASILKDKSSVKVQIEGHCDARGGIQYNIALGEKRANVVKKFLNDQGISDDRITTISYGKERLLSNDNTEAAHSKNRRANFVITSK